MVVERLHCSSATITAAVEPLTIPQISPTTSLQREETLLDIFSRRMASRSALFPMGRHGMKRPRIRRRDGHANHIEHNTQCDEDHQHQNRDPYAAILQRCRGTKAHNGRKGHRDKKNAQGPPVFGFLFLFGFSQKYPSLINNKKLNDGSTNGKSYGLGTGWISPRLTSRCRSGGFPLNSALRCYPPQDPTAT